MKIRGLFLQNSEELEHFQRYAHKMFKDKQKIEDGVTKL